MLRSDNFVKYSKGEEEEKGTKSSGLGGNYRTVGNETDAKTYVQYKHTHTHTPPPHGGTLDWNSIGKTNSTETKTNVSKQAPHRLCYCPLKATD